jgi:hypothetical protein
MSFNVLKASNSGCSHIKNFCVLGSLLLILLLVPFLLSSSLGASFVKAGTGQTMSFSG